MQPRRNVERENLRFLLAKLSYTHGTVITGVTRLRKVFMRLSDSSRDAVCNDKGPKRLIMRNTFLLSSLPLKLALLYARNARDFRMQLEPF